MAILRAQVVLPYLSNKPEDVAVNTWHFDSASTGQTAAEVVRDHLISFYNSAGTSGASIASKLSNALSRATNAAKIKVYDLADPIPRPVRIFDWTLGATAGTSQSELPAEVALCASFYAGRNLPRFRGRVYLGPWHAGNLLDATGERSRPAADLVAVVAQKLGTLINIPANTQNLAVYSRMDGVARIATAGWVDDAWDTQRRRGQDASSRTIVPAL